MKYFLQLFLILIGLGFICALVYQIGFTKIFDLTSRLGWALPLTFFPYGFLLIFDTIGWSYTFPPGVLLNKVGLLRLYLVRLAGEAVNNLTPTAYLGGEPVKASILKRYGIPMSEGLASVIIAKTTLAFSQIVFMFTGAVLLVVRLNDSESLFWALLIAGSLAGVFIAGIVYWQKRGLFEPLIRIKKWIGKDHKLLDAWDEKFRRVDVKIRHFYKNYPGKFLKSTVTHFVAWLLGITEVALILTLLRIDFTWQEAFIIESLGQFAKGLGSLVPIPGSIGIQEGGGVFIFHLLGLDTAAGLTLMLIKRMRELGYSGVGLLLVSQLGLGEKESD